MSSPPGPARPQGYGGRIWPHSAQGRLLVRVDEQHSARSTDICPGGRRDRNPLRSAGWVAESSRSWSRRRAAAPLARRQRRAQRLRGRSPGARRASPQAHRSRQHNAAQRHYSRRSRLPHRPIVQVAATASMAALRAVARDRLRRPLTQWRLARIWRL